MWKPPEFDPLRDEGLAYASKLQAAGVAVDLNETSGTVHGYDAMTGSDLAQDGMKRRVAFLREAFQRVVVCMVFPAGARTRQHRAAVKDLLWLQ